MTTALLVPFTVTVTPEPNALLTPSVEAYAETRTLYCFPCQCFTLYELDGDYYKCAACDNRILYLVWERKPMYAIDLSKEDGTWNELLLPQNSKR